MGFSAPNWKCENEYPTHEEHPSLIFWAWQFLRRNHDYRKDWDAYVERLNGMATRVPDLRPFVRARTELDFHRTEEGKAVLDSEKWNELAMLAHEQAEYFAASPEFLPGETVAAWQKRVEGWTISTEYLNDEVRALLRPVDMYLGEKWGLKSIQNPEMVLFDVPFGFLNMGTVSRAFHGKFHKEPREQLYRVTLREYHVMPIFDLRLPVDVLKGQFDALLQQRKEEIVAKAYKPFTGRPERSLGLFHKYLRVLDAVALDIKVADIADELLPNQDKEGARKVVQNWIKAAKKIRDVEYRLLPAHAAIKRKKK